MTAVTTAFESKCATTTTMACNEPPPCICATTAFLWLLSVGQRGARRRECLAPRPAVMPAISATDRWSRNAPAIYWESCPRAWGCRFFFCYITTTTTTSTYAVPLTSTECSPLSGGSPFNYVFVRIVYTTRVPSERV